MSATTNPFAPVATSTSGGCEIVDVKMLEDLFDPRRYEVRWKPGEVARYEGNGRWAVSYSVAGRVERFKCYALTSTIRGYHAPDSLMGHRIEEILRTYPEIVQTRS